MDAATDDSHSTESLTMLTTPTNIRQNFIIVPAKLRLVILASFVLWKCRFGPAKKLLIFFATQDMVDYHSELFDRCLNTVDRVKTVFYMTLLLISLTLFFQCNKILNCELTRKSNPRLIMSTAGFVN